MADFSDKDIFFQRLKAQGYTVETLAKIMAEQMPSNTFNPTSGSAVWGQITGTLSAQTDLQNALDNAGGVPTTTLTDLSVWAGRFDRNYIVGTQETPVTGAIPAPSFTNAVNNASTIIYHNSATNPFTFAGYQIDIASAYSPNTLNLIVITNVAGTAIVQIVQIETLTPTADLFDTLVSLNPLYAVDLRTAQISDTTVTNLGSAGGTLAKSGTFTKNVGLVAGADAVITATFTQAPLGNSAIVGAKDWVLLCKVKYPTTGTDLHSTSLYQNGAGASTNRIRVRSGGTANNGQYSLQRNDAPSSLSASGIIGTTQTPNDTRLFMLIKSSNNINVYENGSETPTNTIAVGATTEFNLDRFMLFGGSVFGAAGATSALNVEIEYAAFHYVDAGTLTNEADYINLMTLNI